MKKNYVSLMIFFMIIGTLVIPIFATEINIGNQYVEEVLPEEVMEENLGVININNGVVKKNAIGAIINTNNGVVEENNSRININNGMVTDNNDFVENNFGVVNGGRIVHNCGTVNEGIVTCNFGGIVGNNVVVENNYYKVIGNGENISIFGSGEDYLGFNNIEWVKENGNLSIQVISEEGKYLVGTPTFIGEYDELRVEQPGLYYITNVRSDITVVAQTEDLKNYSIIEGNNQIWTGTGDLRFVCNGGYDKFLELFLFPTNQGIEFFIPEKDKDFIVEEGSTIITIKESYLKTLVETDYEIHLVYMDSAPVIAKFEVKKSHDGGISLDSEAESTPIVSENPGEQLQPQGQPTEDNPVQKVTNNPQTGDNISLFIAIFVISTIGLIATAKFKIKD